MNAFEEFALLQNNFSSDISNNESEAIFNLRQAIRVINAPVTRSGKRFNRQISHAVSSNTTMILATTDCYLLRCTNIDNNSNFEEIEISKKTEDIINNIFLDPSGCHTIIAMKNGDNYYLHFRNMKPKKLSSKFQNNGTIESIGFERLSPHEMNNKSDSLKPFLIGTSNNRIYEMSIDITGKEKSFQLIHTLDPTNVLSITSIYFEIITPMTFASTVSTNERESYSISSQDMITNCKIFLMCTTNSPTRIYHFTGSNSFANMFLNYKQNDTFVEFPGYMERPTIRTFSKSPYDFAQLFAIGTALGVYHGKLNFANLFNDGSGGDVITDSRMTPYLSNKDKGGEDSSATMSTSVPISILVTEFYLLALYGNILIIQSSINNEIQQEISLRLLSNYGEDKVMLIMRDPIKRAVYVVSSAGYSELSVLMEDRYAWSMYLKQATQTGETKLFDSAWKLCHRNVRMVLCFVEDEFDEKEDKKAVRLAQAEFYISQGQSENAARHFAEAGIPFDEAALCLLSNLYNKKSVTNKHVTVSKKTNQVQYVSGIDTASGMTALRIYLEEKLNILSPQYKSQRTMIATWLLEVYLHQIVISFNLNTNTVSQGQAVSAASPSLNYDRLVGDTTLVQSFKAFLRVNKGVLDPTVTINLFMTRGEFVRPLLLYYSQINGDYERVVNQYISEGKYSDTIDLLSTSPIEKVEQLIYRKSPLLMETHPEYAISLFLSKATLKISNLLPAMLRYSEVLDKQYETLRKQRKARKETTTSHSTISKNKALSALAGRGKQDSNKDYHESDEVDANDDEEERYFLDRDSDGNKVNYAISYLMQAIHMTQEDGRMMFIDPSVYHTLIWLLCKYDDKNETELTNLLKPLMLSTIGYMHDSDDHETSNLVTTSLLDIDSIDLQYLLRTCKNAKRYQSCIHIHILLSYYELAVHNAMNMISIQFAKELLKYLSYVIDAKLLKKLWIDVAKYVINKQQITNTNHTSEILDLLKETGGVLRIEDILIHLPDFTEIDQFKEEICCTLAEYGARMEELRTEMEELTLSAENIEKELSVVTTRGYAFNSNQRCDICDHNLFQKVFHIFPCGHAFHADCLYKIVLMYTTDIDQLTHIKNLKDQIKVLSNRITDSNTDKRQVVQLDYLNNEMDNIVAADCLLCGEYMIKSVGMSLILPSDMEEMKSWELK